MVFVLNIDIILETVKKFMYADREVVIPESNDWKKDDKFMYFTESEDFVPNSYDELVQIFYSTLNNGWSEFTFYCGEEYESCLEDIATLSNDVEFLSDMNNYVHPYNSYTTIKTLYDDTGEITLKIDKLYSNEEIIKLDKDIDELLKANINDSMSNRDKIKTMHDVIINNTKYDQEMAKNDKSAYDSTRINGVLYDHYGICSGYTDIMSVILTKLDIPNFKISSSDHVWNAVYLDGNWYHLDLTWDDPISSSGRNILLHDYFLIDNVELNRLDNVSKKQDHMYDKEIYLEFVK